MKYIDIQTVGPEAYVVWACRDGTKTAVVLNKAGLPTINQQALGMRAGKNYRPPAGEPMILNRADAISLAHQIGRYILKLGDLVYAYTYVNGIRNEDFFVADLNKALGR